MLDDGGTYKASQLQRYIWRNWLKYISLVKSLAEQHNAKIISVFNGDVFDGDHHDTPQIITRNSATMQRIAYDALKPLIEASEQVFVVRGTETHVGKSGSHEETFAADLTNAVHDKEAGTASWWWLPLEVNGTRFDIAHHGRMGTRQWTRTNALNGLVAQAVFDYAEKGDRMPHLLVRGHRHTLGDTHDTYPIRGIALPSWQLQTAYGNRLSPGSILPIGGIAVICHPGGGHEVHKFNDQPKRRSTHKVEL